MHKLSQKNTSASSGNFQPTSTQKRNGCAKKAYLGTGDLTTLTSTGPLHPSDFALRLKAPQQSAHLRRVEQYCCARQVLPLLLPRPDLLISLVVIHLLLVRPFLSSSSFLPLVVAFDITVSELRIIVVLPSQLWQALHTPIFPPSNLSIVFPLHICSFNLAQHCSSIAFAAFAAFTKA